MRALVKTGRKLFAAQQVSPLLVRTYAVELPESIQAVTHGLAGKYAIAMWNVASKDGQGEAVAKDLSMLVKAMANKPEAKQMFEDPTISRATKSKHIQAALTEMKASDYVQKLLNTLIENKREKLLPDVTVQLGKIVSFEKGEVQATITTARALDPQGLKSMRTYLESQLPSGKILMMEQKVDPAIIGGHIIEIGDSQLDASYKRRVDEVAEMIRNTDTSIQ